MRPRTAPAPRRGAWSPRGEVPALPQRIAVFDSDHSSDCVESACDLRRWAGGRGAEPWISFDRISLAVAVWLPFVPYSQKAGPAKCARAQGGFFLAPKVRRQRDWIRCLLRLSGLAVPTGGDEPEWELLYLVCRAQPKKARFRRNPSRGDLVGVSHIVLDAAQGALYADDECVTRIDGAELLDQPTAGFLGLFRRRP